MATNTHCNRKKNEADISGWEGTPQNTGDIASVKECNGKTDVQKLKLPVYITLKPASLQEHQIVVCFLVIKPTNTWYRGAFILPPRLWFLATAFNMCLSHCLKTGLHEILCKITQVILSCHFLAVWTRWQHVFLVKYSDSCDFLHQF